MKEPKFKVEDILQHRSKEDAIRRIVYVRKRDGIWEYKFACNKYFWFGQLYVESYYELHFLMNSPLYKALE